MEDFLKPIKTERNLVARQPVEPSISIASKEPNALATSPQEALRILKERPNIVDIEKVLKFLLETKNDSFDIKAPGALAAQVIQVLITQTAPDFWQQLRSEKSLGATKRTLLDCIRSVSGLGAILSRLKLLTAAIKNSPKEGNGAISPEQLQILVEIIEALLNGDELFLKIWMENISSTPTNSARRAILWKEFTSVVASSRLMAAVAEAEDILQASTKKSKGTWIAKGSDYTRWIGRNISNMISNADLNDSELWNGAAGMCSKALVLGYTGMWNYCYFLSQQRLMCSRYPRRRLPSATTTQARQSYAISKETNTNTTRP
jgi:telomere length regulation protein